MMHILFLLFVISILNGCKVEKLQCEDLKIQASCQSSSKYYEECYWDSYQKKCQTDSKKCISYSNENYCQSRNNCQWNSTQKQCQNKPFATSLANCTQIEDQKTCLSNIYDKFACTWEHNKCIDIEKCNQINDYKQCRNSRLKDRCQIVVNGKASQWEKQYVSNMFDVFEDFQCRSEDCKFHYSSGECRNFQNGRRCFQYFDECTQCSYFTSSSNCVGTNQCTWSNGICRNILCSDLTSKALCEKKPFCNFNEKSAQCENRTDNQLYCYNRDISSEPLKKRL